MNIIVLSSSPNTDGLTASCADAALAGIQQNGIDAEHIRLNDLDIQMCRACNNGWGICRDEHICEQTDDFHEVQTKINNADGLVLVTPVYWGEMSESAKAFTDRLRRCEATCGDQSHLNGKPVILVAAAGGSGGGIVTCLGSMERWVQHVRARVFDLVGVNRWNQTYKRDAIQAAAAAMTKALLES